MTINQKKEEAMYKDEYAYAHLGSGALQSAQKRLSFWTNKSFNLLLPVRDLPIIQPLKEK